MTKRLDDTYALSRAERSHVLSEIRTPTQGYKALAMFLWGPQMLPEPWMQRAACRGTDEGLWHSDKPGAATRRQRELICAGCPVMQQCAAHLEAGDELPWFPDRETYAAGATNGERRTTALAHPPNPDIDARTA